MKKVTCISYHATGSGAVDDYLREFDGFTYAPSDVECRFLQDPDGISDLEYNLVDNWHRLNSGFAVKRYKKFARMNKRTYQLIFGKCWLDETDKYIRDLVDFEFPGYWHGDVNEQPFIPWAIYKIRRAFSKIMPRKYRKTQDYNYFPYLTSYHCACSREEFYQKTQDYTEALCEKMARPDTEYLVLDQCVSTTNVKRYLNYIRDLKVIIVDRDPRDVYIQAMRDGDHVLPHDPLLFAKQYRDMRRTIDDEIKDPRILRIHFEDLIYRYDFTTKQINEFLGISEEKHEDLRKHFNPDISIRNTQLWINDKNYNNQIKIIEQELEDFLYLFPNREDDRQ